ncbi:zona pellucida protein AX 1 [Polymixia lowei]
MLWSLMAAAVILGQAKSNVKLNSQPSSGLKSDCVGNLMRLTLDKALADGNQLEVEAINGTRHIVLTPSLAAQCGYSMESDPWGNTRIYASLMGCYIDNQADKLFNVGLRLQMYDQGGPPKVVTHEVVNMCSYSIWASQEILCERNYMEVSNYMASPDAAAETKGQDHKADLQINTVPGDNDAAHGIWKMTFYTPEPMAMVLSEAQQAGYGATMTSNRLVLRSPYNTAETYSEDVAGVPMEVFKVSTYYKTSHGLTIVNSAAACPTGGVVFAKDIISWHVPRRMTPLVNGAVRILEMHMGINGQRLDKTQMAARHYTLSANEYHIVIEMPLGSPDGYFKSHAPDYQYHVTYTVEPMLELLWRAEDTQADTRYKVLFPLTTPLMPGFIEVSDDTIPENRFFNVQLGTFFHDVELVNITFATGVLSIAECNAGGIIVLEHKFSNGSKTFSLQVPFSNDVVLKYNPEPLVTNYFLPLIYGFLILPEETPFSHPVDIGASLQDVVLPSISGTCDQNVFYISVAYGSQGRNFQATIGVQELTHTTKDYTLHENGTHLSLVVPYRSPVTVFELLQSFSITARVELILWDSTNNWKLNDLSLACNFPLITTECYSNGTMTALTVKVESLTDLIPGRLTLRDQSCRPHFSNDRFAQFSFTVNSCGTTRTFFDNYMVYENEISLHHNSVKGYTSPVDPEYKHTISCYYLVNDTEVMAFNYRPRTAEPTAETGAGQLMAQLRLAQDELYELFYEADDYPVVKYLRQPLYFEVALLQSADPQLELVLENCWATLHEDRTSLPSWDIIVDGCENLDDSYVTVFHHVVSNARVTVPSHVKRFSIKMFTFTKDDEVLKNQIYVHCDAVICDANQTDGICSSHCAHPTGTRRHQNTKGLKARRNVDSTTHQKRRISSGPILAQLGL